VNQRCHFEWPWVTLTDLAKYPMSWSIARSFCDSWPTCKTCSDKKQYFYFWHLNNDKFFVDSIRFSLRSWFASFPEISYSMGLLGSRSCLYHIIILLLLLLLLIMHELSSAIISSESAIAPCFCPALMFIFAAWRWSHRVGQIINRFWIQFDSLIHLL